MQGFLILCGSPDLLVKTLTSTVLKVLHDHKRIWLSGPYAISLYIERLSFSKDNSAQIAFVMNASDLPEQTLDSVRLRLLVISKIQI